MKQEESPQIRLMGIVGGKTQVTTKDSSAPYITVNEWGGTGGESQTLTHGYGWSSQYGEGYQYTHVNVVQLPDVQNRKMLVGGKVEITNGSSTAPFIEISSWGRRTSDTVSLGNGYAWSREHGTDTYIYYTGFLAQPDRAFVYGGQIVGTPESGGPSVVQSQWGINAANDSDSYLGGQYGWTRPYGRGYLYFWLFLGDQRP